MLAYIQAGNTSLALTPSEAKGNTDGIQLAATKTGLFCLWVSACEQISTVSCFTLIFLLLKEKFPGQEQDKTPT